MKREGLIDDLLKTELYKLLANENIKYCYIQTPVGYFGDNFQGRVLDPYFRGMFPKKIAIDYVKANPTCTVIPIDTEAHNKSIKLTISHLETRLIDETKNPE